jgi:hypothetical protein
MTSALTQLTPLTPVQRWAGIPSSFVLPNGREVHGAAIGWTDGAYMLCNVLVVSNPPNPWSQPTGYAYSLSGSDLTATTQYAPDPPSKANLSDYASGKRQNMMTGGTTVNAVPYRTDPLNLASYSLYYAKAKADANFVVNWFNTTTQAWILLRQANLVTLGESMAAFLADCLAREKQAWDGIQNGTITTTAQIDAIFA